MLMHPRLILELQKELLFFSTMLFFPEKESTSQVFTRLGVTKKWTSTCIVLYVSCTIKQVPK
jgi:hypothetical protein